MYVFATDENNCTGKDSVYVYVYGKTVLLLPTGFTPNKDGRNEKFRIVKHLNVSRLNAFEVYNRWGQIVFSTNDLNEGWDGTIKGDEAPTGVYVWKIDATTSEGEQIKRSGNITLLR
jgi:gliding motility-associated-like protein